MRSELYKLAIWYIGRCNKKWNKNDNLWKLKPLERLTYKNGNKYYLSYGGDNEWKNFSRYDVLDNAIQKLGKYEDSKVELKRLMDIVIEDKL